MTLVLHPDTNAIVDQLRTDLPQGALLKGLPGVGLLAIATHIAGQRLVNVVRPTDKDGNPTDDGSGEIRIAQIRELTSQTRGKSTTPRVIIIDDADKMNTAAQQAFLKLLEEPTANTHFILTAHDAESLMATIVSRVQVTIVKPATHEQSLALLRQLSVTDERRVQQMLFLADGLPAEITRLANDPQYFADTVRTVEMARQFLSGTNTQRATVAQQYHNDRPGALRMLEQAIRIIRATLKSKPSHQLVESLELLATTHERIRMNGNIRLQLLAFVVQ